jgi:hypothetical protein
MNSERQVHDRHLLPGMEPVSITGAATTMQDYADDDAMFDDALF